MTTHQTLLKNNNKAEPERDYPPALFGVSAGQRKYPLVSPPPHFIFLFTRHFHDKN